MLTEYEKFVTVKSTGLEFKPGLAIEEWLDIGDQLKRVNTGIQWWIGDWLNYGEKEYGDKYTQALDHTDYSPGTLRNLAYVAGRIEMSRRHDNVSFTQHAELAPLKPAEYNLAMQKVSEENLSKTATRQLVKEITRKRLITGKENTLDIRLGDFTKAKIEPESIDFIISDLPYPKEYLGLYAALSIKAMDWLKPSGFIAFYSGELNLKEVFEQISGLKYYWTFCLYHEGQTQLVQPRNVICRWKPVLIYQKPPFKKLDIVRQDYIISKQREKDGHDWQQSESGAEALIEAFSQEGDTVLDPACGAGTFVKIAHQLNRNAIGYEIDEETYKIARSA